MGRNFELIDQACAYSATLRREIATCRDEIERTRAVIDEASISLAQARHVLDCPEAY
jgi:hypothetical protein